MLDPQNNALAHAEVTLRSTLSGAAHTVETTDDGKYSFTGVAPGEYFITAAAAGLAAQTRFIHVAAGEPQQTEDISLPLAATEESVTVVSASRVEGVTAGFAFTDRRGNQTAH